MFTKRFIKKQSTVIRDFAGKSRYESFWKRLTIKWIHPARAEAICMYTAKSIQIRENQEWILLA